MQTKLKLTMLFVFVSLPILWATGAWAQVNLDAGDLRFILRQIKISEHHAAQTAVPGNAPNCSVLVGPGPFQIPDPRLPYGLRTVDGSCNNLITSQEDFGSSHRTMPRLTTPVYRPAELGTSFTQNTGIVTDSRPRTISNLISDQTASNPVIVALAAGPDGILNTADDTLFPDPITGNYFIPNVATDAGLSMPFSALFTFFGQFFDHGLTLLKKGGSGQVFVPLQPDDPLFSSGSPTNFMVLTRATNLSGPDGVLGTPDDIKEGTNLDTPFIDQNQTYTSHPSHQVFLRQYQLVEGRPVPTGKLLDGAVAGNIANWAEVKAQARNLLGMALEDIDVLSVPLLLTDPYGHFIPGPNGFPQVVMPGNSLVEGNPAAPVSVDGSLKAGTAFLDDIAHHAVPFGDHDNNPATPQQPLTADSDPGVTDDGDPATYDDELLDSHFITGDGRGNENIALTAIHNLFHSEHNRVAADINGLINTLLTPAEIAELQANNAASGWGYGERLFQAARFVTEMEYSRIVIDTFARKVQPMVNPFSAYKTDIDPAITAEFSHASYRFGHSMLLERVGRTNADGSVNDIRLFDAFLNPLAYNDGGTAGPLTADLAIGSLIRGLSRQVGNEIDEFVTEALRNQLLGLPLDLAAINMMRGRSEGVAPLNEVRRQLFAATSISALAPYPSWFDFGLALRHPESLVNFVAAYGTHPAITGATTMAAKRAAAKDLVALNTAAYQDAIDFMFGVLSWANTNTGLEDVDLWVGGLAEAPSQFGGLLGSTNNYIFETLMERLQDGDRLYYVPRTRGLNLFSELEQNTLSEMLIRNSGMDDVPADIFSIPAFVFKLANLGISGPILDDPTTPYNEALLLIRLPDGTVRYTGPEHVLFVGRNDPNLIDRIWSSEGDDTLRGGDGVDILEGGWGNDELIGGAGDDILTDEFGDDILHGDDGNDALSSGPGLGGDAMFGGRGNDFMVASLDPALIFGGGGNDFIYTGDGAKIPVGQARGEGGDDWLEGGSGADLLAGDCFRPFNIDLCETGHDVLIGGGGNDEMLGEGGDDILVAGPGKEVNVAKEGFDWVTYKADPQSADADLNIAVFDPFELQVLRDKFKQVEALSGGPFSDILLGDDRIFAGSIFVPSVPGMTCDPDLPLALGGTFYCHELTAAGVARVAGLADLLVGKPLPFAEGNILLGGPGSDIIMGRDGNDIIDGDAWLNVQLRAPDPANPGSFKLVDSMLDLEADVFARLINPGDITIVRSISTAGVNPTDVDIAVFRRPRSEYTVTNNPDGTTTVAHNTTCPPGGGGGGVGAGGCINDGVDTLRNIETLLFADQNASATLDAAPSALTFPTQLVGTTSAPQVITVANISAVPITLISFNVTLGNTADFAITTNCGRDLAPTALCTISVTFTPTADGARSAALSIQSSDPLSPITIPLTGVGSGVPATQNLLTLNPVTTPTAAATQEISGTVLANATTPVVTVNGVTQSASVAGANFSATITLAAGTNFITVSSTDTNTGVPTIISATIIRDITPPIVTLNPVTSPTGLAGQLFTGTVEAGATVTVSVNGGAPISANVTGGLLNAQIGLVDGTNTITVTAADPAGNRTSVTATVTVVLPTGSFKGGPVSMSDALKALRMAVGIVTPTTEELLRGDCAPLGAPDGRIDVSDALLILKKVVGLVNF